MRPGFGFLLPDARAIAAWCNLAGMMSQALGLGINPFQRYRRSPVTMRADVFLGTIVEGPVEAWTVRPVAKFSTRGNLENRRPSPARGIDRQVRERSCPLDIGVRHAVTNGRQSAKCELESPSRSQCHSSGCSQSIEVTACKNSPAQLEPGSSCQMSQNCS